MATKRKSPGQTGPSIRRGWGVDARINIRKGWGLDTKVTKGGSGTTAAKKGTPASPTSQRQAVSGRKRKRGGPSLA